MPQYCNPPNVRRIIYLFKVNSKNARRFIPRGKTPNKLHSRKTRNAKNRWIVTDLIFIDRNAVMRKIGNKNSCGNDELRNSQIDGARYMIVSYPLWHRINRNGCGYMQPGTSCSIPIDRGQRSTFELSPVICYQWFIKWDLDFWVLIDQAMKYRRDGTPVGHNSGIRIRILKLFFKTQTLSYNTESKWCKNYISIDIEILIRGFDIYIIDLSLWLCTYVYIELKGIPFWNCSYKKLNSWAQRALHHLRDWNP
jgi:hypothetical protein